MPVADSATFHHTCFLVRDIEAAAKQLAQSLGVTWNLWTIEPSRAWLRGREVSMAFRVAIAELGGSNMELITPVSGENIYAEDLETRGEGFHHTCFAYDNMAALVHAREELTRQGCACVQRGELGDAGAFDYFEVPGVDGLFELLFLSGLPDPEMTVS